MNSRSKNLAAAAAVATLALSAGISAQAQVITSAGPVQVNSNFNTAFGKDGFVLLATTPAGTNGKTANPPSTTGDLSNANFTSNAGSNDPLTATGTPTTDGQGRTIVNPFTYGPNGTAPSYATLTDKGIVGAVNNFIEAGNNYDSITPTLEAGFGGTLNAGNGPGAGGAFNVLQFTLTGNVPAVITFGVLSDFTGPNTGPLRTPPAVNTPTFINLSGPNGSFATVNDSFTARDNDYLFTITGAAAGQTYTLGLGAPAGRTAVFSGVTFDSVPMVSPEPSSFVALGLGVLGLAGLGLKARRRVNA